MVVRAVFALLYVNGVWIEIFAYLNLFFCIASCLSLLDYDFSLVFCE